MGLYGIMIVSPDKEMPGQIVRKALLVRGWKVCQLATVLGVGARHLSNVICGSKNTPRLRRAIEAELNMAIWSSQEEFVQRRAPQKQKINH
jgi:transcriptional regulator with XRE-family HTH domain